MDTDDFKPSAEWIEEALRDLQRKMQALIALAEAYDLPVDSQLTGSATLKEAAYQVLKAAGEPRSTKDILMALVAEGVKVRGKRPGNTLHATLGQDARVELKDKGVWGLVDQLGEGPTGETGGSGDRSGGDEGG